MCQQSPSRHSRVQVRGSELWTLRLFCNLTTTASWACIDHLAACGLGRTRSPATSSSSRVMNNRWHHYLTLSILISARTVQVPEFMITTGVTVDRPTPGLHVWVDDTRRCAKIGRILTHLRLDSCPTLPLWRCCMFRALQTHGTRIRRTARKIRVTEQLSGFIGPAVCESSRV